MVHTVKIRASDASVVFSLGFAPPRLQKRVKSSRNNCLLAHSLPPFVIWNVTHPNPPPPKLHWSRLKDSPSCWRTRPQASVCRVYARAEAPLHLERLTIRFRGWWSGEFSCGKNSSSAGAPCGTSSRCRRAWWTGASSSQLMTDPKLQSDYRPSFYAAACKD